MHLLGKRVRFLWSENGPKLENQGAFTAASKTKWLVIVPVLEINSKMRLESVKNVVLRRFLASRSRLPGTKQSYRAKRRGPNFIPFSKHPHGHPGGAIKSLSVSKDSQMTGLLK